MIDNEEQKEQEEQQLREFMMSNIVEIGKFSYKQEEKREKFLIDQSGKMLIGVSITSVALPFLVSEIYLSFVFIGLAISLIFAVMAGWRFKYSGMASIDALYEDVYNNSECYETPYQFDVQRKYQISMLHKSKVKTNDKRVKYLLVSMASFICSVTLAALLIFF